MTFVSFLLWLPVARGIWFTALLILAGIFVGMAGYKLTMVVAFLLTGMELHAYWNEYKRDWYQAKYARTEAKPYWYRG